MGGRYPVIRFGPGDDCLARTNQERMSISELKTATATYGPLIGELSKAVGERAIASESSPCLFAESGRARSQTEFELEISTAKITGVCREITSGGNGEDCLL